MGRRDLSAQWRPPTVITIEQMGSEQISRDVERMRQDWDQRAMENARYYVATGKEDWSEEEFYRTGEINLKQYVLNDLTNICQGKDPKEMKVLEIGCGAGRITRALAGYFGEVFAVDISEEMVRQARLALQPFPGTQIFLNNGKDLSVVREHWRNSFGSDRKLEMDFAFSYIVFQHIPSREIIENYVREVNRLLRPGALFKFQVQGAPLAEGAEPDTWMGVPFNEREAGEMAERCGFEMRYNHGAGEQYYWLWFFKKKDIEG
jgi:SAM-dependent methyltransferase